MCTPPPQRERRKKFWRGGWRRNKKKLQDHHLHRLLPLLLHFPHCMFLSPPPPTTTPAGQRGKVPLLPPLPGPSTTRAPPAKNPLLPLLHSGSFHLLLVESLIYNDQTDPFPLPPSDLTLPFLPGCAFGETKPWKQPWGPRKEGGRERQARRRNLTEEKQEEIMRPRQDS